MLSISGMALLSIPRLAAACPDNALPAAAHVPEIVTQDEISRAFSEPVRLVVPIEERPAFYRDLSTDEHFSKEFREYMGKRYRLSVIRQNMLDLLQGVHDQKSAESAAEQILEYDKEVARLDIRQAFIDAKRQANRMELYVLACLFEAEGMDCASFHNKMVNCISEKNLYRYETLKRELNPRLRTGWNYSFYMPSFYVSTEPIIAAYKAIREDATCSTELRDFVDRCLKLNDIRKKMLDAVSMICDEPSAVEAGKTLTRYCDEIDDMDMLGRYIEIKDKLSKDEQKMLDRLLRWRYDEATAFLSNYLRIWEEKGLEQYESAVDIIRKSVSRTKNHPLWTDYMHRGVKPRLQIEKSVEDLIFELNDFHYTKILAPYTNSL